MPANLGRLRSNLNSSRVMRVTFFLLLPVVLLLLRLEVSAETMDVWPAPDTLSLIVNAKDPQHLVQTIDKLRAVARLRHVNVGAVFLVGFDPKQVAENENQGYQPQGGAIRIHSDKELMKLLSDKTFARKFFGILDAQSAKPKRKIPLLQTLEDLGLKDESYQNARDVIRALEITYSPTWVVRHQGRDYIFEGFQNPSDFFDAQGGFTRATY